MREDRLFEAGTTPEWTTAEWYADRESAPHLEQDLHRGRLLYAADYVRRAVAEYDLGAVIDLGAGDGGLISTLTDLLDRQVHVWGYDLQESNVRASIDRGPRVNVLLRDVVADRPDWPARSTCAVATEMLEHLIDPHRFVRWVGQNAQVIVASSPWTESIGSHYEYHTWAWDYEGYRALIEQGGFRVVAHETVSMFQIIMGVRE